jgi:outer membrane protein assembly factor BamD (BamD/ComL family)
MANPLQKRQTKKNRFEQQADLALTWIQHNRETFWGVVGGVILVGALIGFVIHQRQVANTDAWMQLGMVQSQAMQGKFADEKKSLDDWQTHFSGSSAAAYAKFLKADLLSKTSDYASAAAVYGELAQTASPVVLRPLALAGQVEATEMAGQAQQALSLAQHFTDQYPDHFLAGSMFFTQARLSEQLGNNAAASALYDRINLLYPQSPYVPLAKTRLQALTPAVRAASPASNTPAAPLSLPAHP